MSTHPLSNTPLVSQGRRTGRRRPDVPPLPRWRVRPTLGGDRGSVSAGLVITTPALLLMLLGIVQFALWSHATHIAQTAASQGLAVARAQHGTAVQGAAAARRILDELARGPLTDAQVQARADATTASVQIHGNATMLIPLLRLPVHAEATGPRELFVPDIGETTRP